MEIDITLFQMVWIYITSYLTLMFINASLLNSTQKTPNNMALFASLLSAMIAMAPLLF